MAHKGEILLIEDNRDLNEANRRAMERRGYCVQSVETLADARLALQNHAPDVILLDVMLPDGDGVDFCREIRGKTQAHIIYLTAKADYGDLSRGLQAGGDDYIRKPFHPQELLDRLDAAMRRQHMGTKQAAVPSLGPLSFNLTAAQAFLGGEDMLLSPKEFAALLLLAKKPGKTLEKERIYQAVWGQPMADNSRALYTTMSRLKKKLAPWDRMIELKAIRGGGYQLVLTDGKNLQES